jgi:hypothetical protein
MRRSDVGWPKTSDHINECGGRPRPEQAFLAKQAKSLHTERLGTPIRIGRPCIQRCFLADFRLVAFFANDFAARYAFFAVVLNRVLIVGFTRRAIVASSE